MGENIAILVIFMILVALGLIFYGQLSKYDINLKIEEQKEVRSLEIAETISRFPEIECSKESIQEGNCLDILKVQGFEKLTTNDLSAQNYYYPLLGDAVITVYETYPESKSFVIYNKPITGKASKIASQIPTSLYDPITDKNSFGYIEVVAYSK